MWIPRELCLEFQVLRREAPFHQARPPLTALAAQRGSGEDRFLACLGASILHRCLGAPKEQSRSGIRLGGMVGPTT